ncbi:MAG: hypothetical protein J5U19_10140 [Candidatus Methanoperedens sp.]|nr:hypothetical protein [Candidatus Methanoperedens sp.]MCE8428736.1 hypothetical protein [Candidatus Methanoperedens sp.]
MSKLIRILAVLLIASILVMPVLGEKGGGMMRKNSDDMMKKGQEIRSSGGMMGMGFMHSAGNSFGNYVTFTINDTNGTVTNYSISSIPVFDSIKIDSFNFKESKISGSLTRITNIENSIDMQLHDNPAAVINIRTKVPALITFNLSAGANATKEGNLIKIEADNLTAFIAANATSLTITGNQIQIESNRINAVFRAVPVNMPMSPVHARFMEEVQNNRAGSEIAIGAYGKQSIVNYSKDMNTMIRSMDKNRMRMTINSTDHTGKFMILNLDNSSLVWTDRQKIRLYLDNKSMRQMMSMEDLYAAKESSFWLAMHEGNRMEAMIYIANFSERTIDVTVEDEVTATPTTAIPAATTSPTWTPEETPSATPKTPGFELILGALSVVLVYLRKK